MLSGADKAEALLSGVARDKSAYDFPVCGVNSAVWMVDLPSSSLLKTNPEIQCIYHE